MGFRQDLRAAAVQLFKDYGDDAGIRLQTYRARPVTIKPPTAFVDGIREAIEYPGATIAQRTSFADCVLVHGIFDSGDAADQADAFMDGFLVWVKERFHAAGANTLVDITDTEDLPNYVPEWIDAQVAYYATRISLEGYAQS